MFNFKSQNSGQAPGWIAGRSSALTVSLLGLVAAFGLLPLWTAGWPQNHELLYFAQRTAIWAEHLKRGEWLPVWAAVDNYGYGSPQPAFYHKLFYLVSGVLYALGGSMKVALSGALWGFLWLGAVGISALARRLGAGAGVAAMAATLLVFGNYTATNWLTRGALAEFSGAMLVPWVLLAFLRCLRPDEPRPRRAAVALGATAGAVFLAHSVLALWLAYLLAIFTVVALALGLERPPLRALAARLLVALGVALLVALPALVPLVILRGDYDMARLLPPVYQPANQMLPFSRYLWDDFVWGRQWQAFTVQLDLPVLLLALTVLPLAFRKFRRSGMPAGALVGGLLAVAAVCLALQWQALAPLYSLLPGGQFIQFPWRLLAILTPVLIVLASLGLATWQAHFADRRRAGWWVWGPLVVVPALVAATAGATAEWRGRAYERFPAEALESVSQVPVYFGFFGEFLPAETSPDDPSIGPRGDRLIGRAAASQGCALAASPAGFEPARRQFEVRCVGDAIVALPLIASVGHRIEGALVDRCIAPGGALAGSGLCAVAVSGGVHRVVAHLPTWRSLVLAPRAERGR